jgi:broad specificity phosphatase PhoE
MSVVGSELTRVPAAAYACVRATTKPDTSPLYSSHRMSYHESMNPATHPPAGEAARIVLVRHGRSAHRDDGRWIPGTRVPDHERRYDAAGLLDGDLPPSELAELARRADILASSDLPRAIESARRLVPGRDPLIVPMLREITLEPPAWMAIPLPVGAWDALTFARWTVRLALGAGHEVVDRADVAADWLVERAGGGGIVVAVTHGGFRRIVASRLRSRGWRRGVRVMGYANWSAWSISAPVPGA